MHTNAVCLDMWARLFACMGFRVDDCGCVCVCIVIIAWIKGGLRNEVMGGDFNPNATGNKE